MSYVLGLVVAATVLGATKPVQKKLAAWESVFVG